MTQVMLLAMALAGDVGWPYIQETIMYIEAFVLSAALGRQAEPDYRSQCQFREDLRGCEQRYPRRHDDEPMHWTATSSGPSYTFVELDHVFRIST